MGWKGQLDLDSHPDYTKNMRIESDPNSGMYYARGKVMYGIDESGNPKWEDVNEPYAFNTDLNEMVTSWDSLLANIAQQNKAIVEEYTLKNGVKDINQLTQ